jgi:cytochrome b subunit of formate dehydrogenase
MSEQILAGEGEVRRHSLLVRVEHWAVALSGIALLFSGLGQMPIYSRYGFTKIPGLGWSGDYFLTLKIHYIAGAVFMAAIAFHVVYHGFLKETAALPRRGDLKESLLIILAMFGFGEEPKSRKFLAEQRLAYAVIGGAAILLSLTGILKVMKNAGWIFLPPTATFTNTMLHNLAFAVFLLGFFAHLAAFLVPANWPLVQTMFTGKVDLAYARHRHPLWLAELGNAPGDGAAATTVERPGESSPASWMSRPGHLTDKEAATLIRVVLQIEPELPVARLAAELGLTDHQFGMGLGLLIREGKLKMRETPSGLMVRLAKAEREATQVGGEQIATL